LVARALIAPSGLLLVLAGACSPGAIGEPPRDAPPPRPGAPPRDLPPFEPGSPVVRRLVSAEYLATVEQVLGAEAAAQGAPPVDTALNGLDAIGASALAVSDTSVRQYEASARAVAQAAAANGGLRARFGVRCAAGARDEARCLGELIARVGRLLFRRTLSAEEQAAYLTLGLSGARAYEDLDRGAALALSALLQSPNFLYRAEVGAPEGSARHARLTPLELASRMAFFLTGAAPDEALLDAAERGELVTDAQVRAQALRLVELPRARTALSTFYAEVLRLRELPNLAKNTREFPTFDASLATSMGEETLRLIEDVVWTRDTDFRELLDASHTFVDARLRAHYGLDARPSRGFERVELPPESRRGGILGHAGLLSVLAHAVTTSPTLRGKFVREVLLCQPVPAPPPGVNTTLPADSGGPVRTMRERLAAHASRADCRACHALMDPIGLGLENFDAVGAFRLDERGATIDAKSDLDGRPFEGARELGQALRDREEVTRCAVKALYRQAVGRLELPGEARALQALTDRFVALDHRLKPLLVELVLSDGFRLVGVGD
jgi:hypothetical protein